MVEGTKVSIPRNRSIQGGEVDVVDSTNILFIFAGSFAGIEDIVRKRMNKDVRVGFGSGVKKELSTRDVYLAIEEEDILEFGIIPELLGRLPIHTTTLPLTDDEMIQVLTQPKNAIIKQFKALYDMDGIDLQFDEAALKAIAQEAQKRPTGARALRSILEKILRPYSYDYPSEEEVTALRITESVVRGDGEAVVVRKKKPEIGPTAAQG
jgi:ATP-dependent Clp protease ATP-binding subunit ClpX